MPALRYAVPLVQLNGAKICKEQNVGRDGTYVEAFDRAWILEQDPSRTQTHREPEFLRDARQGPIDSGRFGRAAGHARDQQRRAQRAAEMRNAQINVGKCDLRQCAVLESVMLEPCADALSGEHPARDRSVSAEPSSTCAVPGSGRAQFPAASSYVISLIPLHRHALCTKIQRWIRLSLHSALPKGSKRPEPGSRVA